MTKSKKRPRERNALCTKSNQTEADWTDCIACCALANLNVKLDFLLCVVLILLLVMFSQMVCCCSGTDSFYLSTHYYFFFFLMTINTKGTL